MSEAKRWVLKIRAGVFVISIFIAGCAIHQTEEIATYRKVIDGNKPSPVKLVPEGPLTLTNALMLAVQNEEQLSLQGETYLQALIDKDKAFANFLPTISLSAQNSYQSTGGVPPHTSNQISASVPGQWNLFNGFRDYYALKASDQTIEQQRQLVLDLEQTVLLDVAQAYYQVLTSEQSVEVLTNSLEAQGSNVKTLQEQLRVGSARLLDVAQAEAQESQTRVSLYQSQADVRNGRAMLAFLVDAPVRDKALRDDFDAPVSVAPMEDWITSAESGRQDLLAADAAVRAARYNVEVAFGQYYPSVNLNLNYDLYNRPFQAGTFWSALIDLNLPIFTGGLIHAEVREAWSLFRVAALTQSQLKRQIDQNVQIAYVDLDLAQRELAELQIEVKAARDEYYLAVELQRNGGGTYLNVQQAQATLLSTQLELTTEQFARKTAFFNLLRTAGELSFTSVRSATRPSEQGLRELATQPVTEPSSRP